MKPRTRPTSIVPLLWIMLFDHTSLNMTFPVLTLLFFDAQSSFFAADVSQSVRSMWYELCVAMPHLVNIFMTPILSALSDEFGRKKILLVGTVGAFLFALTSAFGILWGMLSLLFLGRFIQGAFSRTNPIAQAVVGDISTPENKVRDMGYVQTAISVGACIGPVLGGYFANQIFFAQLNFSLPFFMATVFAGVSCLLTVMYFQETLERPGLPRPAKNAGLAMTTGNNNSSSSSLRGAFFCGCERSAAKQSRNMIAVMKLPTVLRISFILLLSQFSWGLYYQFIPPVLKTVLHFSSHALGLFVGLIALWLALATSFGINVLQRFFSAAGEGVLQKILLFSLYLVLVGLLLSVLFCLLHFTQHASFLMWLAAIPTAMGDVIAYSCLITLYSNAVPKTDQGKVMGVCFIVVALMWSATGLLGGFLMGFHQLLPLFVAPLGVLLAVLLLHLIPPSVTS